MIEVVGIFFFIMIAAAMSPQFAALQQQSMDRIRDTVVAGQMSQIVSAANQYIQENYNSLAATSGTQTITIAQLEQAGYLSPSVNSVTPYDQTWEVQVSQPKPGYLQGVVVSIGGNPMTQIEMGQAASQTKGAGGFIPQAGFPGAGTTAMGAYGGWQISMAGYTNPGSGHMVGLLTYYNGQAINNDYLYRVAIPNNPQLNTMQTDIDMGGNSATNANSYQVTGGGELDTDQGGSMELGGSNTTAGTGNPYIDFHLGGAGVQDFNVRLQNTGNGTLGVYGPNGYGSKSATLNVDGFIGAYGFNGAGGYPAGWGGGIHTWDLYAEGTVGVGQGGALNAYMSNSGNGYLSNAITIGNNAAHFYQNGNGYVSNTFDVGNAYWNGYGVSGQGTYSWVDGYGGVSDTFSVGSRLTLGTAFGSAVQGYGCSPNGEIAANANGSGALMSCVNGVWQADSGATFSQSYQMGVANGAFYNNPGPGPMFLATNCTNMYHSSGATENVRINVYNQYGQQVSTSFGQVAQGGSDANFNAAASTSAVVPSGYYFSVSGYYMYGNGLACSLMVTK